MVAGISTPGLDHATQRVARKDLKERVHMVGHDAPGQEAIPLAVELKEGVLYELGGPGLAQDAATVAVVGELFDARSFEGWAAIGCGTRS